MNVLALEPVPQPLNLARIVTEDFKLYLSRHRQAIGLLDAL
jgi:hypothetical protein